MKCPGKCNSHGTCEHLDEIISGGAETWDMHKIQSCACDPGYTGYDCNERLCPLGDDPLTVASTTAQVQTVTVVTAVSGSFTLSFEDWRGEEVETWPLDVATLSSTAIQEALQGLPNQAIPTVTVTDSGGTPPTVYQVTFTHNSGTNPVMTSNTSGCTGAGCQPVYTAIDAGSVTITETGAAGTDNERVECSARGSCDTTSGLCRCEKGYFGEACESQTVVV